MELPPDVGVLNWAIGMLNTVIANDVAAVVIQPPVPEKAKVPRACPGREKVKWLEKHVYHITVHVECLDDTAASERAAEEAEEEEEEEEEREKKF